MRRVFMLPTPSQAAVDTTNSINQIVLRLAKALPTYGYELAETFENADLIAAHAGQRDSRYQVDVCHMHGLYPTAYANLTLPWHLGANQDVVHNLVRAQRITVPSNWVADILRRDMHVQPTIVPWAIDASEWKVEQPAGYVLFNKTRADGVCSPALAVELAKRLPATQFVSTFGDNPPHNMRVIGRRPFDEMKRYIHGASVYLATTKETFGIGTLEAMACGVPVLGFRHGAITDYLEHGVHGFLAEPGDVDALVDGLQYCLDHRAILGANARARALTYTWDAVAKQIADVYDDVLRPPLTDTPKVSVIIPCHNYAQYVREAIESVKVQVDVSFECILVNDASTDDSSGVIRATIASDPRFRLIDLPMNAGVATARNTGIVDARGQYIVCLDADDKLGHERFLVELAKALDEDRSLGIVYTQIRMMGPSGEEGGVSRWPSTYNFNQQAERHNQVPTCCMFRREAWRRAGGYRAKYTPAEDAELWLRIGALGYRAQLAVEEPWFKYRQHDKSLSTAIRTGKATEPDWTDKPWVETKQFPFAADGVAHPVRNYDVPRVSIIIPVAAHHIKYLPTALDSVEAQTEQYWETIVVNDTPQEKLPGLAPYPWVHVVWTGGGRGAGVARNLGVKHATAPLVTFLDADDLMLPKFLERTLKAFQRTGQYVYTDWISVTKDGQTEVHETPEFSATDVFMKPVQHGVNILIRKVWFLDVEGFDETMQSWEDVEFFMRLAAKGYCGTRVAEPLFVYRYALGQRREFGETVKRAIITELTTRYRDYMEGRKVCNCGQSPKPMQAKIEAAVAQNGVQQMVRVEYRGGEGMAEVIGPTTHQSYGRRKNGDTFLVWIEDQQAAPTRFEPLVDTIFEPTRTVVPPPPQPVPV